jgi:hypothetical protein
MTQDEIIEMARQAAVQITIQANGDVFYSFYGIELEAFAKLVAAREYERGFIDGMQKQMQSSVDKAVNRMAQPKQEPVAWGVFEGNLHDMFFSQAEAEHMALLKGSHAEVRPLYTNPPQRTWVGLTDEEIDDFGYPHFVTNQLPSLRFVVRHLEVKLKEKNT